MKTGGRDRFLQEGLRKAGDTDVLKEILSPDYKLSILAQCELLGLNRSSGMVDLIKTFGILIDHKKVRRLLRKMGVLAIYPGKNLSKLGLAKYIH